jgi:UDP-glucose 4-epimerase
MRKAAVSGGAGFVGSHIVEELLNRHVQVTVIDALEPARAVNIAHLLKNRRLEYIQGSIEDFSMLQKSLAGTEYVFHHAALPNPQVDLVDYTAYYQANAKGMLNVLQAAKINQVRKVIFASSCAVYGNSADQPLREDRLPQPQTPYAVSKLINENYCAAFSRVHGLPTVCLRYFNVYGPRQNPDAPMASVIPKFIRNINDGKALIINGDGEQTRDFIYVKDVVKANLLAAQNDSAGVYNIGSGVQVTLNDLAELLLGLTKCKNIDILHAAERPADIKVSFADIERARTWGFRPGYSLKEGLLEIWQSRALTTAENANR